MLLAHRLEEVTFIYDVWSASRLATEHAIVDDRADAAIILAEAWRKLAASGPSACAAFLFTADSGGFHPGQAVAASLPDFDGGISRNGPFGTKGRQPFVGSVVMHDGQKRRKKRQKTLDQLWLKLASCVVHTPILFDDATNISPLLPLPQPASPLGSCRKGQTSVWVWCSLITTRLPLYTLPARGQTTAAAD